MDKNLLVVNLFVHDMKAPLAVIGSGANKLHGEMILNEYEAIGKDLVEKISQTKRKAVLLLNQILDMDTFTQISSQDSRKLADSENGSFTSRLKRFLSASKKTGKNIGIFHAVNELRALLINLIDLIDALEIQEHDSDIGCHGTSVVRRMRRNAKTALHFAENAIAILVSHAPRPGSVKPCKMKAIIQPVMVEVFDLFDPVLSESIQEASSLTVLKQLLAQKQVTLDLDDTQWDAKFMCDLDKIKQVLVNLLLNAIKFRKKDIVLTLAMGKKQVKFCVIDDGKGIDKKDQPFVYKHRFQVKSEGDFPIRGHGIGLAGAQALLEGINGYLELDSTPGQKTCFSAIIKPVQG